MTTTNRKHTLAGTTKRALTSVATSLRGPLGVVLVAAVAVYAFAQVAAVALVVIGLSLGGGSLG